MNCLISEAFEKPEGLSFENKVTLQEVLSKMLIYLTNMPQFI